MKKTASHIQVIDRATQLLDAIARYPESATLKKLCADTQLAPSTAFRILASLIDNRLVERDAQSHYVLGYRLSQLASLLNVDDDLTTIALPVMTALRDKLAETVHLTTREGDAVIYVEKATPNRMMHVQQMIGNRAPLHVTAVGKLILGEEGETGIRAYAQRTNLPSYTRNTLSKVPDLLQACQLAIQQGFALDNEEAELDVGCIGVLIRDRSGHAIAGLSVSAPIQRRQMTWISDVREAGQAISNQLGYKG